MEESMGSYWPRLNVKEPDWPKHRSHMLGQLCILASEVMLVFFMYGLLVHAFSGNRTGLVTCALRGSDQRLVGVTLLQDGLYHPRFAKISKQ